MLDVVGRMSTTVANFAASRSVGSRFRLQAGSLAIALLAGLLYWRIAIDLFNDWWTQPNLSQGLLIIPFAGYLAWVHRKETIAQPILPSRRGLWLTAAACLLYVLGIVTAEFFLSRISLVLLLTGCIASFWGFARMRTLVFPLVLLATAIPLPAIIYNSAAAPLQLLASDMAANIAQDLGVTVYRDGNIINLAHMSLGVEEACSGLNSLSAMMVGSVLLGFLLCKRVASRWLLFFLSIPLAIAANIVRVSGTAVIADYNEQFAEGFYHALSGWLVFLLGFSGMYMCSKLFSYCENRTFVSRAH